MEVDQLKLVGELAMHKVSRSLIEYLVFNIDLLVKYIDLLNSLCDLGKHIYC